MNPRFSAPALMLALLAGGPAAAQTAPDFPTADAVLVEKAARRLTLYAQGREVGRIEGLQLGGAPIGAKRFQGDRRTPEGRYTIDYGNHASAYHLSLHISYPDGGDVALAEASGHSAGGLIFIHGQPNDLPGVERGRRVSGDWTDGCIAVSNAEIEALWRAVPDGTPIEIRP